MAILLNLVKCLKMAVPTRMADDIHQFRKEFWTAMTGDQIYKFSRVDYGCCIEYDA